MTLDRCRSRWVCNLGQLKEVRAERLRREELIALSELRDSVAAMKELEAALTAREKQVRCCRSLRKLRDCECCTTSLLNVSERRLLCVPPRAGRAGVLRTGGADAAEA